MNKKEKLFILLGIIFISFNLRAPITAVGSIVGMITEEYHLTSSVAGMITTLPLIAFALVSPFVSKGTQRWGYGQTMMLGLLFILLGAIIRSYTNILGLFVGTAFIGIGIAIGNVLIPSIIKLKFPQRVGQMSSIYTSSMCLFAALGAGISTPLAKGMQLGWKNALAIWLGLTLVTLFIWSPQVRKKSNTAAAPKLVNKPVSSSSIWKDRTAWLVTLFMGIQSLLFYCMVAWLPTILVSKGMTATFASNMALIYQLIAIPATLIVSLFCDRFEHQRGIVMSVCSIYLLGILLFLVGSTSLVLMAAVILLSIAMGGSICLAIAFISLRSPNASKAAELSGMSQSAGYLLAAIGPTMMGALYDLFSSWTIPLIILTALVIILAYFGWHAGHKVSVEE